MENGPLLRVDVDPRAKSMVRLGKLSGGGHWFGVAQVRSSLRGPEWVHHAIMYSVDPPTSFIIICRKGVREIRIDMTGIPTLPEMMVVEI